MIFFITTGSFGTLFYNTFAVSDAFVINLIIESIKIRYNLQGIPGIYT